MARLTAETTALRDAVEITRGYQTPAQFLNYFTYLDSHGKWQRARSITLDVQMRSGEQTEEGFKAAHAKAPLGFGSTPDDIAEAVSFAARVPSMTGTTIVIDGGQNLVRRDLSKLWPLTSASQCGSAATMPPARTENALAETRGLTHTIR